MFLGNQNIRKKIQEGFDIQNDIFPGASHLDETKDIYMIKDTIEVIKKMKGVKQVQLSAKYRDGGVMIPEGKSTSIFYLSDSKNKKEKFGFTLRCDRVDIENNYQTDVTILQNNVEILNASVGLYEPLIYKNYIFYLSNYQPYKAIWVKVKNLETGKENKALITPGKEEAKWPEEAIRFGIINIDVQKKALKRIQIRFDDNQEPPSKFWIRNAGEAKINRKSGNYIVAAKRLYAAGLAVIVDESLTNN